ncbi:BON domain-containing protein [Burkholderia singularis]|uniref:Predicted periplasmic or secreted lipoprotein n=1 Tax=Burkholderia singularis TaxID=1503053 RepID=A0A238H5G6_9BURK|nr:BON domain-containing protein [Burkholderia singularis]SMG00641.1 Predicted periplasmic or secreted lipoprotein [Burkholderia singularis]
MASAPAVDVATRKQHQAEDRRLKRRVSAALARVRGLNSTRLIVRAHDGDVTLLGTTTDTSQIELAVQAAQRVDGVKRVQNAIRIGEPGL